MKAAALTALGVATTLGIAQARLTEWGPCPDQPGSSLSCAYFDIPLDYHNASVGNGQILVVKANATSGDKKGTIFLNPGK